MLRRVIPPTGRCNSGGLLVNNPSSTADFARIRVLALAVALLFASNTLAMAIPIPSQVIGCVADSCTIEPIGGPVAVDPLGFTLDVAWGPIFLLLNEDPGGHGLMNLFFTFTGVHDGTEALGQITLLDSAHNPIPGLNVSIDDLNADAVAGTVRWNYEIFGPSAFLHGFSMALGDGSGVDTMAWTGARIFPAEIVEARVPEPSLLYLLGAGLGLALRRRRS
jgi:hypothetical protein